jgi:hypothetical protein
MELIFNELDVSGGVYTTRNRFKAVEDILGYRVTEENARRGSVL